MQITTCNLGPCGLQRAQRLVKVSYEAGRDSHACGVEGGALGICCVVSFVSMLSLCRALNPISSCDTECGSLQ